MCDANVDADAATKKNRKHMIDAHNMVWVDALIAPTPNLPDAYDKALAKCKERMREHAYGR